MWATMNKNNILRQKGVTQMFDQIFYKERTSAANPNARTATKTFIKDTGKHYYNFNDQC